MPPRRKISYKPRSYQKKKWYDRKYTPSEVAYRAFQGVQYLKGLVNSEMFHFDRSETAITVNSTGSVANLLGIAQGDGSSARTGNSILVRNHLLRIRFVKSSSATTTIIRMMLVQDLQQVGDTSPAVGDILDTADVDSPLNLSNAGRFKVLMNKTISLHASYPIYHSEKYKNVYYHVRYNGTAATDIQKNGVYLLLISDQATNIPLCDYWSRIGYHDN